MKIAAIVLAVVMLMQKPDYSEPNPPPSHIGTYPNKKQCEAALKKMKHPEGRWCQ